MIALWTSPEAWAALLTLTALEIVLGIDNVIFLSVMVSRIPPAQAKREARLLCPECGSLLEDKHRNSMNCAGKFLPKGDLESSTASFWVSGLASPWRADLLVVAYAVVVFTIVVQGLTMPWFLRAPYGEKNPI